MKLLIPSTPKKSMQVEQLIFCSTVLYCSQGLPSLQSSVKVLFGLLVSYSFLEDGEGGLLAALGITPGLDPSLYFKKLNICSRLSIVVHTVHVEFDSSCQIFKSPANYIE